MEYHTQPSPTWRDQFTQRELRLIANARTYADNDSAGLLSCRQAALMRVPRLSEILDTLPLPCPYGHSKQVRRWRKHRENYGNPRLWRVSRRVSSTLRARRAKRCRPGFWRYVRRQSGAAPVTRAPQ